MVVCIMSSMNRSSKSTRHISARDCSLWIDRTQLILRGDPSQSGIFTEVVVGDATGVVSVIKAEVEAHL